MKRVIALVGASAVLAAMATPTRAQDTVATFSVLFSFAGQDGANPHAGLLADPKGNLYGTTEQGGAFGEGTAFKVDLKGRETVIHSFGGQEGYDPEASLVRDAAGNLYGTVPWGGDHFNGTVFQLDNTGNATVLHAFKGAADGAHPIGGLLRDTVGRLYGVAQYGGSFTGPCAEFGCGAVFELDKSGNEQVLHAFKGSPDGASPAGGLVRDGAGTLYGATNFGGDSLCECGLVFKIDKTGRETVLHTFHGADGKFPFGDLILDPEGNLYGTTFSGGSAGFGTVFKINNHGVESVLYDFLGEADGEHPNCPLVRDSTGNLYGTAYSGGDYGLYGTVFKIDPAGTETTLHSFSGGLDGGYPLNGLIMAAGRLYGTTSLGGLYNEGSVFAVVPLKPKGSGCCCQHGTAGQSPRLIPEIDACGASEGGQDGRNLSVPFSSPRGPRSSTEERRDSSP